MATLADMGFSIRGGTLAKASIGENVKFKQRKEPKLPKKLQHAVFEEGDKVLVAWEDGHEYEAIIERVNRRNELVTGYFVLWATGQNSTVKPADIRKLLKRDTVVGDVLRENPKAFILGEKKGR